MSLEGKVRTEVEVRNRFTGDWSVGFEVVGCANGVFHVRRLRDGAILPVGFGHEEIRVCASSTERVERAYVVVPEEGSHAEPDRPCPVVKKT